MGLIAARWFHFAAIFTAFGCSFFWLSAGRDASLPWAVRATSHVVRIASGVAVVSGLAWLFESLIAMSGGVSDALDHDFLQTFFFETPFGSIDGVRIALWALLLFAIASPAAVHRRFAAIAAISAVLLISQAWLGHAAEGGDTIRGATMIAAYVIHVLAAAAWIGALPALLFALIEERAVNSPSAFAAVRRFADIAAIAVCLILLSGIANSAFRVQGNAAALFDSRYGTILLVKLALVAGMIGLAGYNRFGLMPNLGPTSGDRSAVENRLRSSIVLELVLGIAVLGAAAVLGITPPPM